MKFTLRWIKQDSIKLYFNLWIKNKIYSKNNGEVQKKEMRCLMRIGWSTKIILKWKKS